MVQNIFAGVVAVIFIAGRFVLDANVRVKRITAIFLALIALTQLQFNAFASGSAGHMVIASEAFRSFQVQVVGMGSSFTGQSLR